MSVSRKDTRIVCIKVISYKIISNPMVAFSIGKEKRSKLMG